MNYYFKNCSFLDYDHRWKMLHYSALDFFSPIILVPEFLSISDNFTLYLVSDILTDIEVIFSIEIYNWDSLIPLAAYKSEIILLVSTYKQLISNIPYILCFV